MFWSLILQKNHFINHNRMEFSFIFQFKMHILYNHQQNFYKQRIFHYIFHTDFNYLNNNHLCIKYKFIHFNRKYKIRGIKHILNFYFNKILIHTGCIEVEIFHYFYKLYIHFTFHKSYTKVGILNIYHYCL